MILSGTSSTSSSSGLYSSSMNKGIGGLVSGLNTDELVEQMTSLTRSKIARQYQSRQKLLWKQDAYRSAISDLSSLQSKFFNVDSEFALSSQSFFSSTKASSSSDAVTILGSTASSQVSFEISSITQLASSAAAQSSSTVSGGISGTVDLNTLADPSELNGKSIVLELNGVKKTIELSGFNPTDDAAAIQTRLQSQIDAQFKSSVTGGHMIEVGIDSGKLTLSAQGSRLNVYAPASDSALESLGLTDKQSNKLYLSQTLENISFAGGAVTFAEPEEEGGDRTVSFSINGEDFTFKSTDTLSYVLSKINSSQAGVKVSYSESSDKFTFAATETGEGSTIDFADSDGNNLLRLMGGGGYSFTGGKNAIFELNGTQTERSSNIFTVDGVKMELAKKTTEATTISAVQDTDKIIEGVKEFINAYNGVVDSLYPKLTEKVDSDYPPLTDEQKEDMTESEIKLWEEKAKSGLLRSDSTINGILNGMRTALNEKVEAAGLHLSQLGISTTSSYKDGGKLQFEAGGEAKLRELIESRPGDVALFFNSTSTEIDAEGNTVTVSTGVAAKIRDTLNSAIKSIGEPKGTLIELAGVPSSSSDTTNTLSKQIADIDEAISNLKSKLVTEENRYWKQFSALETALAQLNSQSNYLQSFFQ